MPCWGLTQPLPDPQTTAEHSCNAIIKSDLANLDHLFGAYANGEIAGFEGALTVLEGGSPTALSGTALAQIVRLADDPLGPAWALQLTVPGSKRWIQVLQYDANPDTLVVGDISEYCCVAPPSETSGVSAPAGGIDLGAPGSSLTLDLSALPPDGGAPHPAIAISANLTRLASVPPTFALEFEVPGTFDFAVEGDEIVRHRSDWNITFATGAPPQFQGWGCGWSTVYSLDQYVKLDEPSVRGVRNVILQKGEFYCATDCVNEHCATGVCCAERESCQPDP